MSKKIIAPRRDEFNLILSDLRHFFEAPIKPLIYKLYELGLTTQEVADLVGVSRQKISEKFPKKEGSL